MAQTEKLKSHTIGDTEFEFVRFRLTGGHQWSYGFVATDDELCDGGVDVEQLGQEEANTVLQKFFGIGIEMRA